MSPYGDDSCFMPPESARHEAEVIKMPGVWGILKQVQDDDKRNRARRAHL